MVIQLQTDAGNRLMLVRSYGHHHKLFHTGVFIIVCIAISCKDHGGMLSNMIETRMNRVSLFPKNSRKTLTFTPYVLPYFCQKCAI